MKYQHFTTRLFQAALFLLLVAGPFHEATAQKLEGMASFYGDKFDGRPTSTGETFRKNGYSAASLDMPWGTILEVTNLSNGRTTQVRVNDCGPHAKGRIIDLSRAAAEDLDFIKNGETKVRLRVIKTSNSGPTCNRGAWTKKLKKQGKAIPSPPPPWDPTQTVGATPVKTTAPSPVVSPPLPMTGGDQQGLASYYADRFQGRSTSTGEVYDHNKFTAASKAFAYGTRLEVTNIVSGAKTEVVVNDCGPHTVDRILDLSRIAAQRIGVLQAGTAMVRVKILEQGTKGPTCNRSAWLKAQKENAVSLNPQPAPASYGGSVVQPVPASTTKPVPATVPVKSADEQPENMVKAYVLQVGAFGKRANAERMAAKLTENGFSDSYTVTGAKLTKVFTGLAATEADAEKIKEDLIKAGYSKPKVVATLVPKNELATHAIPESGPATYGSKGVETPQATAVEAYKPTFSPEDILFGVQIGAYATKTNAVKMMKKLKDLGFDPVYSADLGKSVRVFVGKFYFQSQARTEKGKLQEAGIDGTSVRRVQ
jgi:rare lipoprotein A